MKDSKTQSELIADMKKMLDVNANFGDTDLAAFAEKHLNGQFDKWISLTLYMGKALTYTMIRQKPDLNTLNSRGDNIL